MALLEQLAVMSVFLENTASRNLLGCKSSPLLQLVTIDYNPFHKYHLFESEVYLRSDLTVSSTALSCPPPPILSNFLSYFHPKIIHHIHTHIFWSLVLNFKQLFSFLICNPGYIYREQSCLLELVLLKQISHFLFHANCKWLEAPLQPGLRSEIFQLYLKGSVFLILYPVEADAQGDTGREDESRSILSCQCQQGLSSYQPITPIILWFYVLSFRKVYTFLCLSFPLIFEELFQASAELF